MARKSPFPPFDKGGLGGFITQAGKHVHLRIVGVALSHDDRGKMPLPPQKPKILGNFQMFFNHRAIVLLTLLLFASPLWAAGHAPVKPGSGDKCPVCGMFVAKYPDWTAEIIFSDGSVVFFDGVKDMLKYYFNLKKYNPRKAPADIQSIFVMDYYAVELIDGRKAFYVSESDTYGPMGKELIPFEKETQAQEFLKDHKGKAVLTFGEIDPAVIKGLD